MLTRVYIDGYNFYYGCLRKTNDKWIDPLKLVDGIMRGAVSSDGADLSKAIYPDVAVKYFTAPILVKLARSRDSVPSQVAYHQALKALLGSSIEIIEGYYDAHEARAYEVRKGVRPIDSPLVDIWKVEEKQSDVSLALHAFRDVVNKEVQQVVIVTNDTDLEPCLKMIRDIGGVTIGLVVPTRDGQRAPNDALAKLAHWTRASILDDEFKAAHLPNMIRAANKSIHRPLSWYPRPDLLEPLMKEAIRVKKSRGAGLKWMNQPQAHLGNRIPIEMASTPKGASELRAYMDKYARDFGIPPDPTEPQQDSDKHRNLRWTAKLTGALPKFWVLLRSRMKRH